MKLILTGGGVGEKAKPAFSLLAKLLNGGLLLYIPFAEEEMTVEENLVWFKQQMKPYGIINIEIVKTPEELTKEKIDNSSGIFIGGGNAFVLLKKLKESNTLPLIQNALTTNKLIIGLSAGATIFGKDINSCLYDELKIIANDKNLVGLEDTKGIEIFEDYSFFVHYKLSQKQLIATQQKVEKILSTNSNIVAIPEESCIFINNNDVIAIENNVEVITKENSQTFNNNQKLNLKPNKKFRTQEFEQNFSFERAKLTELKEIMCLYENVIKNTFTTWDKNYPSEQLIKEDILKGNLYIMKYQNKIIASSFLGKKENSDSWTTSLTSPMSVARICVSPSFQGIGLGKMFLKNLISTAKVLHADGMRFHVCTQNKSAMKMYENCGFKNCGLGKSNYGFDYFKYEQKFK